MVDTERITGEIPVASEDTGHSEYPQRLGPGLWVVGNPYFNLYLVRGENATALIEVGVSGMADEAIRQIDSLGARPTYLVVTHPHADHVTGLDALREHYPGARVVVGEGAPEFLAHPKAAASIVQEDRHMSGFLISEGYEPGRPPVDAPPSLAGCAIALDGDETDLGGLTLRFLEAKGHAPGNIIVFIPELEALIVSDSLGFRFRRRGFYPLFFTNFPDHIDTIDRLHSLKPKILGVPHQGPRMGEHVEADFRQARAASEELRAKILENEGDEETVAEELFTDTYKDEFLLYTPGNIKTCCRLLVRRAKE